MSGIGLTFALGLAVVAELAACGSASKASEQDEIKPPTDDDGDKDTHEDKDESSTFSLSGGRDRLTRWGRSVGSELDDQVENALDHAGTAKDTVAKVVE